MFGTFKIGRCSLSDDQQTLYKAHFCTSCHALDAFGGWPAAATTNYDQTLLGMVLAALSPTPATMASRPCTVLKFRPVSVLLLPPDMRKWLAAFNLALVAAKLQDDESDEPRLDKRLVGLALRQSIQKAWHTLETHGFDTTGLRQLSRVQDRAERDARPSLDSLSDPTASVLGDIFAFAARSTGRIDLENTMRSLGRATGRYVYLWDAVRDVESDERRKRFNALLATYGHAWSKIEVSRWLMHELRIQKQTLCELKNAELQPVFDQLFHSMSKQVHDKLTPHQGTVWARHGRMSPQAGSLDGCDCCSSCCDGANCDCCSSCSDGCDCCGNCADFLKNCGCDDCCPDDWTCCGRKKRPPEFQPPVDPNTVR